MDIIMSLMLFLLVLKANSTNLHCNSNECTSCTSGYNYLSISCLQICPTGYIINQNSCKSEASQDLFVLHFISHRKFLATSIGPFSHPNQYAFSNDTKVTPFPLFYRGFYFYSTSVLESKESYVLAPHFILGVYFKVTNNGKIFRVLQGDKTILELKFEGTLKVSWRNLNKTVEVENFSDTKLGNIWTMFHFCNIQQRGGVEIYHPGLGKWTFFENFEFRMDVQNTKFIIGGEGGTGFEGFLLYLCMRNDYYSFHKEFYNGDCIEYQSHYSSGCNECQCQDISFCYNQQCVKCMPGNCNGCTGYMYDDCSANDFDINVLLPTLCSTIKANTCATPTPFDTITLDFNTFSQYKGEYFKSGNNEQTYSPWNNPEADDPIALSKRGYMFNSSQFMSSNSITLKSSFTITVWISTSSASIIRCDKLHLFYDGSLQIQLSNTQRYYREVFNAECFQKDSWSFIGVSIDFSDGSTHFKSICKNSVTPMRSVKGFGFFDQTNYLEIRPDSNQYFFIYRMTISQTSVSDLSSFINICSTSGSSACLNLPNKGYLSIFGKLTECHPNCLNGCRTWGTCNLCSNILCKTCDGNFEASCSAMDNYDPCQDGFVLSRDRTQCCRTECASCYGSKNFMCWGCASNYVLLMNFCTFNCPSKFELKDGICESPNEKLQLDVEFNKMSKSFNDKFDNSFNTGSISTNSSLNDPIPAKFRGFYFKKTSFVSSSLFGLSNNFTISFWMRQNSAGTLFSKGGFIISSEITVKLESLILSFDQLQDNTWIVFNVMGFSFNEYYFIDVENSQKKFIRTEINGPLHDLKSNFTIGNGFEGFISRVLIYAAVYGPSSPNICNSVASEPCLWNCDLNYFLFGSSCSPCKASCTEGCVRESDCNKCPFINCDKCSDFSTCASCTSGYTIDSNCKCEEKFYLKNSACLPCNNKCKTCTGPESKNCISCFDNSFLNQSSCICQNGFYWNGSLCEICDSSCSECKDSKCFCNDSSFQLGFICSNCHPFCQRCAGPTEKDCLCVNKSWSHCDCEKNQFLYKECIDCHSSCASCFEKSYFQCLSCHGFLLSGICFESCPRGFLGKSGNCEKSDFLALGFYFDSQDPLLEQQSNQFARLSDESREKVPFVLNQRGIFFQENSKFVKFKSDSFPLVSQNFLVKIWLRVSDDSEVFRIFSSDSFQIWFLDGKNFSVYLKLNNVESFRVREIFFEELRWHQVCIGLFNHSSYFLMMSVDGVEYLKEDLLYLPYKDSSSSELFIGKNMTGFIYSFEIFTYFSYEIFLNSSSPVHLINCEADEFESEESCQKCQTICKYGCLTSSECIFCNSDSCLLCNNFLSDTCDVCRPPFVLKDSKCSKCSDSQYFNSISSQCSECPSLCSSCLNNSFCLTCSKNSQLSNNSICECEFGFMLKDDKCLQRFFKALGKIDFSNLVTISFSEPLKEWLTFINISATVDLEKVDVLVEMENFQVFYVSLIIPDEILYKKERLLNVKIDQGIISVYGAIVNNTSFDFVMFDQVLKKADDKIQSLQKSAKSITVTAAAAALTSGTLLMKPTIVFNLLNLVEMFSYALLFDLEFDEKFIEFLVSLKKSSKLPSLTLPITMKEASLPKKYIRYNIESTHLIINSGYLLILMISSSIVSAFAYSLTWATNPKISNFFLKILKFFFFRWFHRACIQGCFDLSIFCLLSIRFSDLSYNLTIFDWSMCFVASCYFIFWIFIHILFLNTTNFPVSREDLPSILNYFSVIFEEFNCKDWNFCLFYIIFIVRRMFLSILIIYSNGILQLMASICFCLMTIFYLHYIKPFKETIENFSFLINESLLLVFYAALSLKTLNLIHVNDGDLAIFSIRVIIGTLGFNIFINAFKSFRSFYQKIKARFHSRVLSIASQAMTTQVIKMKNSKPVV